MHGDGLTPDAVAALSEQGLCVPSLTAVVPEAAQVDALGLWLPYLVFCRLRGRCLGA